MWSHDVYSCDTVGADLPICVPGEKVNQYWPRVSKQDLPCSPRKVHQTHTSSDAPSFLASTILNGVYPRSAPTLPPEGYLTHIQRRRRVTKHPDYKARVDDTAVSIDSPSWIACTLKEHAPHLDQNVRLTSPRAIYRLGAANRVVLAPLVEIDPFTGKPPRALPKPFAGPGYIPIPEERARVDAHYASTGSERLGETFAAEIGSGTDGGVLLDHPAATLPARERFGATAASAIGDVRQGGALVDTLQFQEEAAPPRMLVNGATYRAEPPYSDYFTHKRDSLGLPSLSNTARSARWTGVSPKDYREGRNIASLSDNGGLGESILSSSRRHLESVASSGGEKSGRGAPPLAGHALYRALSNSQVVKAGQHLTQSFDIAKDCVGPATLQASASSPQTYKPTFKSGPLHCTYLISSPSPPPLSFLTATSFTHSHN